MSVDVTFVNEPSGVSMNWRMCQAKLTEKTAMDNRFV